MKHRIFILIISIIINLACVFGQDVDFYKESITFKIEKDYFYVNGDYYLKSTENRSQILFYPFPVGNLYGDVDSVSIFDVNRQEKLNQFNKTEKGVYFTFTSDSLCESHLQIAYRQILLGNQAEYILETTQVWAKPLISARYQLITGSEIDVTSFSYDPDRLIELKGESIYFWAKQNFMPQKNMIFTFSVR